MATSVRVTLTGDERLRRALRGLSPDQNPAFLRRSLRKMALLGQKVAAEKKIERGGKGPPLPDRLTSRSGALRRSIGVDLGDLPFAAAVGTELVYGAVHELGLNGYPVRAFLRPAFEDSINDFERILEDEWLREVNRA